MKVVEIGDGAGKYDAITTRVREELGARGVVLIIDTGDPKSAGFEVQVSDPNFLAALPFILRTVADDVEQRMPAYLEEIADRIARESGAS